jgi:hypothetical protein
MKLFRQLFSNRINRTSTFYLRGGLGNQLFGYYAGEAYRKFQNVKIIYDLSELGIEKTDHGVYISDFNLNAKFINKYMDPNSFKMKFRRIVNSIFNRNEKTRKVAQYLLRSFHSDSIGYDPILFSNKYFRKVHGYFQSYKYFEIANKGLTHSIEPLNPSEWYLDMKSLAEEEKPIILHIRRGDSLDFSVIAGWLSSDYYANCISKLRSDGFKQKIWVFSDDIPESKKILSFCINEDFFWVEPPINSSANESIALMTKASAFIIPNSTYSWWGAILSGEKPTLCPKKWFKNLDDPKDLLPPNWQKMESYWV